MCAVAEGSQRLGRLPLELRYKRMMTDDEIGCLLSTTIHVCTDENTSTASLFCSNRCLLHGTMEDG